MLRTRAATWTSEGSFDPLVADPARTSFSDAETDFGEELLSPIRKTLDRASKTNRKRSVDQGQAVTELKRIRTQTL